MFLLRSRGPQRATLFPDAPLFRSKAGAQITAGAPAEAGGNGDEGVSPLPVRQDEQHRPSLNRPSLTGDDVSHVKIVDFDEEIQKLNRGHDKIKISYFD